MTGTETKTMAQSAEAITATSNSNLALAFFCLPKQRRQDMVTFYAFCRLADDAADQEGLTLDERKRRIDDLRNWIDRPSAPSSGSLAADLGDLIARRSIKHDHFHAILDGVEQDLQPQQFRTIDDLLTYCHLVASEVGLVSIEIFGYSDPRCHDYAVHLGYALQLTNIIRDVGEDLANDGRIYLPLDDLAQFELSPEQLPNAEGSDNFQALMSFEAKRAREQYRKALAALPATDRRNMVPGEIMRKVYAALLNKIEADGFPVISRRYRLCKLHKLTCIIRGYCWPGQG